MKYATLLLGLAILMASVIAARAEMPSKWKCGRDLVEIPSEVSGFVYRNGNLNRPEDLIMGGIYNRPSGEFRWKKGKLSQRGKPCRIVTE